MEYRICPSMFPVVRFSRAEPPPVGALAAGVIPRAEAVAAAPQDKAQVFFTPDIGVEGLLKVYARINRGVGGSVAVKLHTGEPHGPNILPPDMVRAFLEHVPGHTIVECNVLYASPRQTTAGHREVLKTNGWTFSPVDIMDEDGDVSLPVPGGRHLKEVAVGAHLINYDSMLVLTHFKGHAMGGFGGSLKNISIGCASGQVGKQQIHQLPADGSWVGGPEFMERMVEGGKAVTTYFGPRIVYINVLRRMSVSCDCEGVAARRPPRRIWAFWPPRIYWPWTRRPSTWSTLCPRPSGMIWWSASNPGAACASFRI